MKLFSEPLHTLGKVKDTHAVMRMRPEHDETLRYAIPIPKGWGRATSVGTPRARAGAPEPIGVFSPTQDLAGPRVLVTAKRLQWEVDPLEWVRHAWIRNGWKIELARRLGRPWANRFEIGGTKEINGVVDVRRTTGFIDNGRLLRVDVAAPQRSWPHVHDLLWPCGVLFELREPTLRPQIEAHPRHKGPGITFTLPASWHAGPGVKNGCLRWVAGLDADVQRCAALRIDVTSSRRAQPMDRRQRAIAAELRESGVTLDSRTEPVELDVGASLDGWRGHHRIAARGHGGERFEVRMAHRETKTCTIDYIMLAPEPGRYHLDWMRATRAFDVAIDSTKVLG